MFAALAHGLATKKFSGKFASRFVRKPLLVKKLLDAEPNRAVKIGKGTSQDFAVGENEVPPLQARLACAFLNSVRMFATLTPFELPQVSVGAVVRSTQVNGIFSRFSSLMLEEGKR